MQQHTGQHLLSAVLDRYNLPTLSWNMGEVINYVELPRKLSEEEINKFNAEVNDEITRNIPIKIEVPTEEGPGVHEEKGVMRVVHIGELDSNPCCGTHLSSTGQIDHYNSGYDYKVILENSAINKKKSSIINENDVYGHSVLHDSDIVTDFSGSIFLNIMDFLFRKRWRKN